MPFELRKFIVGGPLFSNYPVEGMAYHAAYAMFWGSKLLTARDKSKNC